MSSGAPPRLALALALAGALACRGLGVRPAELPEALIAVRYYDPESARRNREEALELRALQQSGGIPQARSTQEGVAHVDDLRRYAAALIGPGVASLAPLAPGADYRHEPDERSPRLALLDPRTGALELLPGARRGAAPVDWSPDRRRLLFTQIVRGYPQLFEYDRETREVRPITREPGAHPGGCYGPEGRFVAASFDPGPRPPAQRLEISEPGGAAFKPLTEGPADAQPACAPGGGAIAWTRSVAGGESEVVVRAPVLEGALRVIGPGVDPRFSPDGEALVYAAPVGTRRGSEGRRLWQLRRIRVDGLARANLGGGSIDEREPAVSPDGALVAYVGVDAQLQRRLYVRRSDGSGDRVLFGEGEALGPVW